jgi:hypothetical protein
MTTLEGSTTSIAVKGCRSVAAISEDAMISLVMEGGEPIDQGIYWRFTHSLVNDPGVCWLHDPTSCLPGKPGTQSGRHDDGWRRGVE